jgi:hypothetical protein
MRVLAVTAVDVVFSCGGARGPGLGVAPVSIRRLGEPHW